MGNRPPEGDVAEALDALDLARRRFVNVVGHELRTPVTTVRGLAEGGVVVTITLPVAT